MNERTRPQAPALIRIILPAALIALYLPLVVMVAGSFLERVDGSSRFSLRWYHELAHDPVLWGALGRSVTIAFSSAALSTVLAILGSLALERWVFKGRWPLRILSTISLMLPELVLALSLLSWFSVLHMQLSLVTVAIAHITLTLPFAIFVVGARLQTMEGSLEDAARDLGAGEWQVLTRVTLPLLGPAIVTAFLLAFLLSFDDFLVTFYTNGAGGDTLPVKLYSLMKTGLSPKLQALSTIMLLLSVVMVIMLVKLQQKNRSEA
ncbi:MAG TPA: ABC transporter permease [Bdellovibrionales bacterium]|nr:ABC transporter permease [Bdellovibrionales bacterium]